LVANNAPVPCCLFLHPLCYYVPYSQKRFSDALREDLEELVTTEPIPVFVRVAP
jgi:hypothetical protein